MKKSLLAKIENGKIVFENPCDFIETIKKLEGEKIKIFIEKYKKQRSNNQNKYYWSVVIALLSEKTGHSTEETHDALRIKFLKKTENENFPTIISTSSLSALEFENFISKVRNFALLEFGLTIPLPNEAEKNIYIS